jgi:signal transduction histidine kinase
VHSPEERLQILLEASELLASSIDYETTLANLPRILVPQLADACIIDLIAPNDTIERIDVTLADPINAALVERLKRTAAADTAASADVLRILEEGRALLTPDLAGEGVAAAAHGAAHLEVLRALAPRSSMVVPMRARGRPIGLLWLYTMESDRRYGPADLALVVDLCRRAALAIENARLYAEAQSAIRSRDVFLTVASHELRTPLTALQIQVHSVRRLAARAAGAPGPPPGEPGGPARSAERQSLERIAAKIEVAARQVARLTRLVDDLLDVSQIGAGRLRLRVEQVDLGVLVREILSRLEGQLAQSRCGLSLSADEAVVGMWDRSRIEQVIVNLLSNAMKYGAGKPIEIELSGTAASARLRVRDHGIGIAAEDQARIFERFERAVSARQYAGLGMGLWIVRKIVAAHGGSIRVDSRPGAGATFTIELPLKAPSWAAVERRQEA